ncbi:hypothetical protein ACSN7O_004642 [Enterobacter chuandaensis]
MNMMRKMSLLALAVCAAGAVSTTARADDKSWGKASAKVTVNAAQEWTIEKVNDGSFNIGTDGKLTDGAAGGNAAGQFPQFKISNKSQAGSYYYIAGNGTSAASNGKILMINDDAAAEDPNKRAYLKAFVDNTALTWDSTASKWKSPAELAAGTSEVISFKPQSDTVAVPAGSYTMTVELFMPSA